MGKCGVIEKDMSKTMTDKKQIMTNLLWSIISGTLSYIVNFFITPIITNNVGIEAYGFISLGNTLISYINIISVGINSFSARYIAIHYHNKEYDKANEYFNSVLGANIFLSVLIVIPATIMITRLEQIINIADGLQGEVKILFALIVVNYFVGLFGSIFGSVAFIKNKIEITAKISGVSKLLYAGLILGFFYFIGIKVYFVALANLLVSIFIMVGNGFFANRLIPEISIDLKKFSFSKIKNLLSAGIYNSINYLGGTLGSGLDLLITNKFLSNVIMGQISVGNQFGTILNAVILAVSNVFQPKQLEAYSHKKIDELLFYFKVSINVCGFVANTFWGCFLFLGIPFLQLWIPHEDFYTIFVISLIVILGNLIVAIITPLYYVTTLTARMKWVSFITVGCGVANVLSMFVLLNTSCNGAFVVVGTTTALNLVALVVFPCVTKKYLGLDTIPFKREIMKHFICSGFLLVVYLIIPFKIICNSWIDLILKGLACGGIIMIIVGILQLSSSERRIIWNMLKKRIKK